MADLIDGIWIGAALLGGVAAVLTILCVGLFLVPMELHHLR